MSALAAGANLAAARLRRRASLVAFLMAAGLVAAAALVERRSGGVAAADHTLVGAVFGVAVPLIGYLAVERSVDGRRLQASLDELARYGANRRAAALGLVGVCAALVAGAAVALALLGVVVARGTTDAGLAADLARSSWIAATAGVSYTLWFALGSSIGRRGGGRIWALALDWVLGSTTILVAAPWPRGHIRNLLGGAPVLGLAQWQGGVALAVLISAYLGLSLWRLRA